MQSRGNSKMKDKPVMLLGGHDGSVMFWTLTILLSEPVSHYKTECHPVYSDLTQPHVAPERNSNREQANR